MKILSAKYTGNATSLESCPPANKTEYAFIGRSNVGKSSLINSLTNFNGLAKVSTTPGKTRMINFFTINDHFNLVDLPGYGYAKVSRSENREFNVAAADYLSGREGLKCVFVLIDSRREPQDLDLQFFGWIREFERNVVLVFTKSDLLSKEKLKANMAQFQEALKANGLPVPKCVSCSAKSGAGKMAIFEQIQRYLPKQEKSVVKKKKTSSAWLKNIGM